MPKHMKDVISKTGCEPLHVNAPERHPRKGIGCNLARFTRRAKARMVMIRTMDSRFVHALLCLTRNTCRGEAACRAATSLDKKFASFPTITCGNYGWMPNLFCE